jgi:dTDP-4-dehydrorhamnose reductase
LKVLILGNGQVANAVAATALEANAVPSSAPGGGSRGIEVVARARAALDIVDSAAVLRAFTELQPDWVVNAAAYTAVDLAEDQKNEAFAVNATAVAGLASAAAKIGCRLLHLSTDFVFDGGSSRAYLPGDAPNPLSVYGASKLAGERHVAAPGAAAGGPAPGAPGSGIVLRTSWVYAATGKNFVLTMLRLMREKPQLSVVCDQIGAPTWATSIGRAIWGLIQAQAAPGIYHWTDLGVASWYDFAVAIQDEALARGLLTRLVPVTPIASSQYPTRATRPAFSLLDTASTRSAINAPGDHWRHNLRKMLDELRAQ